MIRTTSNRAPLAAVLAGCLLLGAGCGDKDYGHRRIGKDSPEYQAVAGMLETLRRDGVDAAMAAHGAPGLDESRKAALRATLQMLADAESAELLSVDEFGPQVYRATFRLDGQTDFSALLVRPEHNEFYWAGKN